MNKIDRNNVTQLNPGSIVPYVEGYVVYEKKLNTILYEENAEKEVERRGWVTKIREGQYVLHDQVTKLFIVWQNLSRELSRELGYREWIFPRLQTEEAIKNYGWLDMDNLRPELMIVKDFENDGQRYDYEWFLDPLQCPSFYRYLSKISPVKVSMFPLKIYEWRGGWTYRNEKKKRLSSGFGTAFEFSGLELVYAGLKEDVLKARWDTMIMVVRLLELLELDYRVVVGSSCSHEKEGSCPNGKEEELYQISTIDLEVRIPYEMGFIEIGGADFIGTRLVDNFGIKTVEGVQLYSGCQGIGWQRLTKAFLSQKGFDIDDWPKIVRDMWKEA